MSRRTGQNGSVFQIKQKTWNPKVVACGQFYVDTPDGRAHRSISLGLHPTKSRARCKLREYLEEQGISDKALFQANAPDLTFREQAEELYKSLASRRRRPPRPATMDGYRHALNKWILPQLGDLHLAEVSNGALRKFVAAMRVGKMCDTAIVEYSRIAKVVVASAVNQDGEPIYKVTWNHDFVDMPIINREKQNRPSFTSADVEEVLMKSRPCPHWWILWALFSGTGIRPMEVLALKDTDIAKDGSVIYLRRVIYSRTGKELDGTKTKNSIREIDVAEPLAEALRCCAAGKSGYLFGTKNGGPMRERNVLRYLSTTLGKKGGLRQFRRFHRNLTQGPRAGRSDKNLAGPRKKQCHRPLRQRLERRSRPEAGVV